MYRQIVTPTKERHSIEVPEKFFGKRVQVIMVEFEEYENAHPPLPQGKKISFDKLFETFGTDPDFPSVEEIRNKAWSSKW